MAKDHVSNGTIMEIFQECLEDAEFATEEDFKKRVQEVADEIEEELGRAQRFIERNLHGYADDFDCKIQEYIAEEEREEREAEEAYQREFGGDDE